MKKLKLLLSCKKYFLLVYLFLFNISFANSSDEKSKSFQVSKGGKLEVNIPAGDIRVNPWEKNEALIKIKAEDEDDLDKISIGQYSNIIHIECDKSLDGFLHVLIYIPSEFNVELKTGGGNIQASGKIIGKVLAATSGGNIKIGDVNGNLEAKTSGGEITLGFINGDCKVSSSGGDLRIAKVSGETIAKTSGGNIEVGEALKVLTVKTAGGNIYITNAGSKSEITTAGGNIYINKLSDNSTVKTGGGNIDVKNMYGKLEVKTGGGNISLNNLHGSFSAKTGAGNIMVDLYDIKSSCEASTGAGDIVFSVNEECKADIVASLKLKGSWDEDEDNIENLYSDFKALRIEKEDNRRNIKAYYEINNGGFNVELKTSYGKIKIKKLKK